MLSNSNKGDVVIPGHHLGCSIIGTDVWDVGLSQHIRNSWHPCKTQNWKISGPHIGRLGFSLKICNSKVLAASNLMRLFKPTSSHSIIYLSDPVTSKVTIGINSAGYTKCELHQGIVTTSTPRLVLCWLSTKCNSSQKDLEQNAKDHRVIMLKTPFF